MEDNLKLAGGIAVPPSKSAGRITLAQVLQVCYFITVVWYFEEDGVVLGRGLYGTWKRVVWYLEEGGVVL